MTNNFDFLVVGAGIIGLTVALELTKKHPNASICIVEKESDAGLHASGRNSGVLHSGIYYGNDTLKSKMCSKGARKMKNFALKHDIGIKQKGKVIISTSDKDLPGLDRLFHNAKENSIAAYYLNESEVKKIEPNASPYKAGIYVPDTSVIDSNLVISKLKEILITKNNAFSD